MKPARKINPWNIIAAELEAIDRASGIGRADGIHGHIGGIGRGD